MNKINQKKSGFTLVESMIAVTISATAMVGLITLQSGETKQDLVQSFIEESYEIIRAVDHRIAIDGYDPILWSQTSWNNESDIVNNLIGKELTSKHLTNCSGGDWDPASNSEAKTKLIGCNHWKTRKNNGEIFNAELTLDGSGFIQGFNLYVQYDTPKDFQDSFLQLKKSMLKTEVGINQELTGSHYIDFINFANKTDINSSQCLANFNDCAIRFSINRNGGNEYLRADGGNSMIGEHLTFVESKGQSAMKCIRWVNTARDGSGAWTQEPIEDCGIGIYTNDPHPVMVDVVADTGTFKNVVLDQECNVYSWTGNDVVDSGIKSPCGVLNQGGEVIQVVDNINSKEMTVHDVFIKNIYSNSITSEFAYIENKLMVDIIDSNQNSNIVIEPSSTFKDVVKIEDDLYTSGNLIVSSNINAQGNIHTNANLTSNSNITSTGHIISKDTLLIEKIQTEGDYCSDKGSLSVTTNGTLLNCVNNNWESAIKDSTPIGSIQLWGSTSIPSGWLEMNGQSTAAYPTLRSLVGNNVPDMRGTFARGWDHGRGLDSGRSLRSYQSDADQRFTAYWNTDDRSARAASGIASSAWNSWNGGADGGDRSSADLTLDNARQIRTANESRPKNIALMYIIKAQ